MTPTHSVLLLFSLWSLAHVEGHIYLTTHSTHFISGYMASDIWWRTTQIAREKTRCRHIGYSFRLAERVLLYASSHRQDNAHHGLCYTSHRTLAGTRNNSFSTKDRSDDPSHHERTLLLRSYILLPCSRGRHIHRWIKKPARVLFYVFMTQARRKQNTLVNWLSGCCCFSQSVHQSVSQSPFPPPTILIKIFHLKLLLRHSFTCQTKSSTTPKGSYWDACVCVYMCVCVCDL